VFLLECGERALKVLPGPPVDLARRKARAIECDLRGKNFVDDRRGPSLQRRCTAE